MLYEAVHEMALHKLLQLEYWQNWTICADSVIPIRLMRLLVLIREDISQDSSLSITKHGNVIAKKILYRAIGQIDNVAKAKRCHIVDYYESKKRSSQTKGVQEKHYCFNS